MRLPTFLRSRRHRRATSAGAMGITLVVLVVAAIMEKGFPNADVSLNDGGVWVTKNDEGLIGRFNRPIEQLDALLSQGKTVDHELELLQEAGTVLLHDHAAGALRQLSVTGLTIDAQGVQLPGQAKVALGGGVVAVLDTEKGRLWVRKATDIGSLDLKDDPVTSEIGAKADVVVGRDGTVHAVSSAAKRLTTVTLGGEKPEIASQALAGDVTAARITAVGGQAVVLGKDGKLVLPGGQTVTVAGAESAVLQQAGPDDRAVLVATTRGLLAYPLDGGEPARLFEGAAGPPAAPVRLVRNGVSCAYGAWAGQGKYLRRCSGFVDEPVVDLPAVEAGQLTFRVNRDVIVLNDALHGGTFMVERGGDNLGNWEALKAPTQPLPEQPADQRKAKDPAANTKPIARDDQFGVRPGQAALLTVLDNDGDADGDVLQILPPSRVPSDVGRLSVVHHGQALQFTAAPGSTDPVRFSYTIDDGRGGTAEAHVVVNVRPLDQNSPPHALGRAEALSVEQGGTVSTNVLDDWRDPDGDPLVLVAATATDDSRVQYGPEGQVTFTDSGRGTGAKTVELKITDGIAPAVSAKLSITVLARGIDGPPVARDDIVAALVGQSIQIRPLANDSDPNSTVPGSNQQLQLAWVQEATNAVILADYVAGTVSFKADQPGPYQLRYRVAAGPATAEARIRVDVRRPSSAHPPVAVADQVALRGGLPATVDVLANDLDLDGDVLVVQSVSAPDTAGLTISVVERRWLRVVASQVASGTAAVRYVVSDGTNSDTGVLQVTRMEAGDNQPPIARPDVAIVRVNDVVAVDVLQNDSDPEGTPIQLDPTVIPDDERGMWLVAGRVLRYQAGEKAGSSTATYSVRDAQGRTATAQVTVTVLASDPAANQPPQPPTLEARAFAGAVVRVPVALTGVDPDGDTTMLLGATKAPALGRIVGQGIDYFDYEAYFGMAGTDEFGYQLQDAFGKRGTGLVRIGVAPLPERNSAPVAVDDVYTVRPGVTVRAPVLANDSDVDGDALRLEPLAPLNPQLPPGAQLDGERVVAVAGAAGQTVYVSYGISDGRGQRASATLVLIAKEGANLAPVARDDLVTTVPAGQHSVEVDVLRNDDDLDGTRGELKVEVVEAGGGPPAEVVGGGKVRITLAPNPRQIAYRITDPEGASAVAFVRVPGEGNRPPARKADAAEPSMTSGTDLVVDLASQIADPEGARFRLTAASAISTSPVPGLNLVEGSVSETSLTVRAAPDFRGSAVVIVEVTDATTENPNGASAFVSIPVNVFTPGAAPLFRCSSAEPRAGAPAVLIDLRGCVYGIPESERRGLTFTDPQGAAAGITARLIGEGRSTLEIKAGAEANPEVRGELKFTVATASGGSAEVTMAVLASPALPAVATTDEVSGVKEGTEVSVDVIGNDVNPFPETPLKVVHARTTSGEITVTVEGDARHVKLRAAAGFHGRATATYQIQDATGRPDRVVSGEILVNVIGRPAAPAAPAERTVGDATAVITWTEPEGNGAPITGYEVRDESGRTFQCATTVCSLTGLTNGQRYRFAVRASNEAGWSDYGPVSEPMQPDVQPDQPEVPTTVFGDSAVTVNWTAPASKGSPVVRYEVEVSPSTGGIRTVNATTLTWPGLTNGAAYRFRVRAFNGAKNPSEWSAFSAPEVPAKAPEAPAAPTAAGVTDGIGEQIVVNWSQPATNGAPVTGYELLVLRGGSTDQTITTDGDTTQATVTVQNGVAYTFRVVATNKAGPSAPGAISADTVAHGRPFAVTSFAVADNSGGTGFDRRVSFDVPPPGDNGMAISRYEFDYTGDGGADYVSPSPSGFVTGVNNGATYQLRVRACNDMCADWSPPSGAVTPYGPVPTPGAGASRNGLQVILSWSPPGTNGRPLNRLEIRVDGGGWENVGTGGGSRAVGNGPNQTHSIEVRAFDSAGQVSSVAGASASTEPPRVVVTPGSSAVGRPGCSSQWCRYIVVELLYFAPGSSYSCSFNSSLGSGGFGTMSGNVDGNGHVLRQSGNYFGVPSSQGGWAEATCNGVTGRSTSWP